MKLGVVVSMIASCLLGLLSNVGSDGNLVLANEHNAISYFKDIPETQTPTITPTGTPTITPCCPPTTPTPTPALEIDPMPLAGEPGFLIDIRLNESINQPFDYYIIADTQFGFYTLYFDGNVKKKIKPLYRNVLSYPAPYENSILCGVVLPFTLGGQQVTFYTAAVEAGKIPPIKGLPELTPTTQYVIMMDKKTVTIGG